MMYSEFIERTKFGGKYITESMYHDYIEPAYLNAPDNITKDVFCKDFYKLHRSAVTMVIGGLINTLNTEKGIPLVNIEYRLCILRDLFLKAFPGIAKEYYGNKRG